MSNALIKTLYICFSVTMLIIILLPKDACNVAQGSEKGLIVIMEFNVMHSLVQPPEARAEYVS